MQKGLLYFMVLALMLGSALIGYELRCYDVKKEKPNVLSKRGQQG